MKVSIGYILRNSSWGGGNQFGNSLKSYLEKKGCDVCFDLSDSDIDIILLTEPNKKNQSSTFDHIDILRYLLFRNPNSIVVHRINNTSQARNDLDLSFNKYRVKANRIADYTVFVSNWVHRCYMESGYKSLKYRIIYNGGDKSVWYPRTEYIGSSLPLKLVTHHWSTNQLKGFSLYRKIDEMLLESTWAEKIEFTYIGRLPQGMQFKQTKYYPPVNGESLAALLRQNDAYLTGSLNEAGPNHCIEGALCGLPLLYIDSGALPEYCNGYGVCFNESNFKEKLIEFIDTFDTWKEKIHHFPLTSDSMSKSYYDLFSELMDSRQEIIQSRNIFKLFSIF